ncbi:MAG TPA: helix-hairpin-helix domain-containing protein [Candidatus Omnitrophota bacterium]|nr:helix-hairpin-helix domain-containing protein [Candidatus Omnitrophota bacterium]
MIYGITGKIVDRKNGAVVIESGALRYEVLIPSAVMRSIDNDGAVSDEISLVTYHYFQMSQSSGVPVLIGFRNDIEKEFFEKFISVSGIGPRAACRALAQDFSKIASAIDEGNESVLRSLPGIGARKAAEIIAKLKGKVGKFCLIRTSGGVEEKTRTDFPVGEDIRKEAIEILKQLQYRPLEAEEMVRRAMARAEGITTSEELLNEVYRQRKPD